MASDLGSFYDKIELEENTLSSLDGNNYLLILVNILIVVMILIGIFYLVKGVKIKRSTE